MNQLEVWVALAVTPHTPPPTMLTVRVEHAPTCGVGKEWPSYRPFTANPAREALCRCEPVVKVALV